MPSAKGDQWLKIQGKRSNGMNIPAMNYFLYVMPFCICIVVLAAILMLREYQHQEIQKGLLDRLLVSQGHNPLPDIEPMADLTGESKKADIAERIEEAVSRLKHMKQRGTPVRFNIPNMPQPRAGMGETKSR
jgi:hypothetical protein